MNSENNIHNMEILINMSKNIKFISLLTVGGLIVIIFTNFLPMMHWSIELIGKFVSLLILMYAIKLSIMNINDILSKTNNIFIDPNQKDLKNITLLSYLFSACIFILIIIIMHSLFYNT